MSLNFNGPINTPLIQEAQSMLNNGGGGNTGYFRRDDEQQQEEEIKFTNSCEDDSFEKSAIVDESVGQDESESLKNKILALLRKIKRKIIYFLALIRKSVAK